MALAVGERRLWSAWLLYFAAAPSGLISGSDPRFAQVVNALIHSGVLRWQLDLTGAVEVGLTPASTRRPARDLELAVTYWSPGKTVWFEMGE